MEGFVLRDFLEIPYDELEERNLAAKQQRLDRVDPERVREEREKILTDTRQLKAVTVCFTDLEGRMHMLDYDKKFLLRTADNLTFDGSSIRGFSQQHESDLRLAVDWPAFYWLPADVFGPGKVLVFANILGRDGSPYAADLRGRLARFTSELHASEGLTCNVANEIEGFLFRGRDAERKYHELGKFEFISTGGYYHSLPGDELRTFIDRAAETQRAMGFQNEKDHPEVAPSQFEMNYSYTEALVSADQIQLYKLLCRQIAQSMDMTASFLPKPVAGVNGNGMHTNMSLAKGKANLFWDPKGEDNLSAKGWEFVDRILNAANDICLALNPSVNSYRRLDPHFEAPNQIKSSANNRGAMVRIPYANERSARIEVRSVAPDANPYLVLYTLFRVGTEGPLPENREEARTGRTRFLPGSIYDALRPFKQSRLAKEILGDVVHERYAELKQIQADRCPRALGALVKPAEIQFHHEVTNQFLWSQF
ncbi:MAG: glutamine synthetase family protein [Myxococcota bacterium]